jgi:ribonuclease-3 family protein
MRAFQREMDGRLTIKTLVISSILYLVLIIPKPTLAFTAHLTGASTRTTVDSGAHTLWGKGRIQRVGPKSDSDDRVEPKFKQDGEKELVEDIDVPSMSLEELLLPSSKCDLNQVGPTALAYVGDVVFELMVRVKHVWPTRRTSDLQRQVVALVRGMLCTLVYDEFYDFAAISLFSRTAEHQAKLLALLYESCLFQLTPKEEQILLRGRNSASSTRSRQNAATYQDATALEALIGYLYLSDRMRCQELMNWIYAHLDQVDE